jgi:renalase
VNEVAIIGAGMAGLAAAHELRQSGLGAVVFEKSRGVAGRAATRRRDGRCYDHGANFFRTDDPEVHRLVHERLPTDELVEIPGPVWTFDADSVISEGDPAHNSLPKYTYRRGISTLGKLLAASADVDLRRQVRVTRLQRAEPGWRLIAETGEELGCWSRVILTPPAPQTAEVLASSDLDASHRETLLDALRPAAYHRQFSFVLGYQRPLPRPHPFHALVNAGGGHAVAWLGFENDKPGHVPPGETVLIAQMAPDWSDDRYDHPRDGLLAEVLREIATLLPDLDPNPDWWDSQRWGFAHPVAAANEKMLSAAEPCGIFIAGDAPAGRGRVPLAIKSGLATGRRLLEAAID